uniref:Uncharacterized protein n=1 Tax=Arundo donax TaxID=35708 RepID=A0A0A9CYW9_ARUDO
MSPSANVSYMTTLPNLNIKLRLNKYCESSHLQSAVHGDLTSAMARQYIGHSPTLLTHICPISLS